MGIKDENEVFIEEELEKLYLLYGFNRYENDKFLIFVDSKGYFKNAEVVLLNDYYDVSELEKSEKILIKDGFQVRSIKYKTINEIRKNLFDAFFSVQMSKLKIEGSYKKFIENQNGIYGKIIDSEYHFEYEYKTPKFKCDGNEMDDNIIDFITEVFSRDESSLIVLEAPAGHGKTCTSQEIIKNLSKNNKIIMYMELSKNRMARIFKYVLLDEINQNFDKIKLELVLEEINDGNIILFIDGFDELLSDSVYEKSSKNINVDTMLNTIAELYKKECKTKILLTSRKSSIFFNKNEKSWDEEISRYAEVYKMELGQPNVKEWLSNEKIKILNQRNIDISNLANPVLLTFLKVIDECIIKNHMSNTEEIVNCYFSLLFNREQERQNYSISEQNQREIFCNLVYGFILYQITSDSKQFIKELLEEYNNKFFDGFYDKDMTKEELINKLAGHALLNRDSIYSEKVNFINDFVFGYFIVDNLLDETKKIEELSKVHYYIALSSAINLSLVKKNKLFDVISNMKNIGNYDKLEFDRLVTKKIRRKYANMYIENTAFNEVEIDTYGCFSKCTFTNCFFNIEIIDISKFDKCVFIRCSINSNVDIIDRYENTSEFNECNGNVVEYFEKKEEKVRNINSIDEYEKKILMNFDRNNNGRHLKAIAHESNIFKNKVESEKIELKSALTRLIEKGFLTYDKPKYYLVKEKMVEILKLLEK